MKRNNTDPGALDVIYEDNHLLALNKKSGQIVQGDKTGDVSLFTLAKAYIKEKYQKPGRVFLGVVHRLDRPVSGLLLYARTSKSVTRLNEMFRENRPEKVYWAIVQNKPPADEGTLENFLKKDPGKNKSFVCHKDTPGARHASMTYRMAGASQRYCLLEVRLHTGRHHQIRVQLAHVGCPVKGDLKYGYPRSNKDGSISLHARKMCFIHPVRKTEIKLVAPVPDDPLWLVMERIAGPVP